MPGDKGQQYFCTCEGYYKITLHVPMWLVFLSKASRHLKTVSSFPRGIALLMFFFPWLPCLVEPCVLHFKVGLNLSHLFTFQRTVKHLGALVSLLFSKKGVVNFQILNFQLLSCCVKQNKKLHLLFQGLSGSPHTGLKGE